MSKLTINFIVKNGYLDPVAQKAYIEVVNGCVELNDKTVHITWFDLADAFGSVSHLLIPFVMKYYNIPTKITSYISNLYSKLKGKVVCKDRESELFQFLKGVFQGVIFLTVFNPLLEYIKTQKEKQGYNITTKITAKHVITTPFADDFNVISRNIKHHQNLVTDVENKLKTMGLVIKASKCRSLSIQSGITSNIQFNIKDSNNDTVPIYSVIEKPMRFLGSELGENNSPHAMSVGLHIKLQKKKLENMENIKQTYIQDMHFHPSDIICRYTIYTKHTKINLTTFQENILKSGLKFKKTGSRIFQFFIPTCLG